MESNYKHRHSNEFQPVAKGTGGFGIPQRWINQVNIACTNWLRNRGLYSDDPNWRYQLDKKIRARLAQKKTEKFDAFIDNLSSED